MLFILQRNAEMIRDQPSKVALLSNPKEEAL